MSMLSSSNRITQTDYIKALTCIITINGYGLPDGIYRPDLLPALPEEQNKIKTIDLSTIQISHTDLPVINASLDAATSPAFDLIDQPKPIITDLVVTVDPPDHALPAPAFAYVGKYLEVAKRVGLPPNALDKFEQDIDAAFSPLDFTEGFPTFDGIPFWAQLPYESAADYTDFTSYLQQPNTQDGIRQLFTLDSPRKASLTDLQQASILYYWPQRAKAYDIFNIIQRRKERERQAMNVENMQLAMANRLMSICEAYIDVNAEELQESLSPKNFVELLKTASAMQRISVGLAANGPSASTSSNPILGEGTSTEVLLRAIANSNTVPALPSAQNATGGQAEQLNALRGLLNDPKTLDMAQELIIRMNSGAK